MKKKQQVNTVHNFDEMDDHAFDADCNEIREGDRPLEFQYLKVDNNKARNVKIRNFILRDNHGAEVGEQQEVRSASSVDGES